MKKILKILFLFALIALFTVFAQAQKQVTVRFDKGTFGAIRYGDTRRGTITWVLPGVREGQQVIVQAWPATSQVKIRTEGDRGMLSFQGLAVVKTHLPGKNACYVVVIPPPGMTRYKVHFQIQ